MAISKRDGRRSAGWHRLIGSLLGLPLTAALAAPAPPAIDEEWRQRFILEWGADQYRGGAHALTAGKRAFDAIRPDTDVRTQLRAATRYLMALSERAPVDCALFKRYVDMAKAGGSTLERELFDLGAATVWAWIAAPCPSQIKPEEMEALAQRLGDPARMYYVLEARLVDPWATDRRGEQASLMSKQMEYAIAGYQRASRLMRLADLELAADLKSTTAKKWLERAEQEFDADEFPMLAGELHANLAIVEFRANATAAALTHMERALARIRKGDMLPDVAAMNLISFARYLLRLDRIAQALALIEESNRLPLAEPNAIIERSMMFLLAYARIKTPEAFAKGQREIERIYQLQEGQPEAVPRRPQTFQVIADFYEAYGRYDAALRATQQMVGQMEDAQRRINETARLETQEKLEVALKDKENAQLKADAELQAERQRGWIAAFVIAALGVAAAGTALALAVRRGRRLARVSAELAQRNGELEQRSASRIRLLAAACHDLRQPAHALGMLAELGSDAQREPGRFSAWLQSVRRSTASLGEMLDELMDLGRLDGGHYTPLLSEVPLGELMQEVMLHFGPLARRKGLTLQAPPVDASITSDRHLLRRILFNVVSNAIKYTDSGDVRVSLATVGGQVRLSVQDSGPGIPQDKIDDVFRDYVRLNPMKAAEGLGIGLSIVRRAAELLGHELTLESEPGQGTCVSLTLPLSRTQPAAAADGEEESVAVAGGRLAVIENDADVRDAMVALLTSWGYAVRAGSHAAALLAPAGTQTAALDLVITDLHLDQTDGLTEVARLREGLNQPALPALLVTGDLDGALTGQAALAGVYVAHKPLAPRKLAALVRQLLSAPPEATSTPPTAPGPAAGLIAPPGV
jgi:signal transduction histidine kinase/CheY-like chemotaxis protein